MKKTLSKIFNLKECKSFSNKTGDFNILHTDKEINKFSQFEKPVVQGIQVLEFLLKNQSLQEILKKTSSIFIVFKKPIFIDEKISFKIKKKNNELLIIGSNLFQDKIIIKAELTEILKKSSDESLLITDKFKIENLILKLRDISKIIGNYKKNLNLISTILISKGKQKKKSIIKISNNLYKLIYTSKNLTFKTYYISFEKTFIEDKKYNSKIKIHKKKYKDNKVLVIGGSSGLGKILSVFLLKNKINLDFTYNKNFRSAIEIKKKFRLSNNRYFKFNEKKLNSLKNKILKYRYIYFFATPKIFNFSDKYFDYEKFSIFNNINIKLMLKIINILSKSKQKHIFYIPSTKLVKNLSDNIEYNSSKLIQETILKKINKSFKNIKILNPRLDSYLTRSTKGLLNNKIDYDNFLKTAIDHQ